MIAMCGLYDWLGEPYDRGGNRVGYPTRAYSRCRRIKFSKEQNTERESPQGLLFEANQCRNEGIRFDVGVAGMVGSVYCK